MTFKQYQNKTLDSRVFLVQMLQIKLFCRCWPNCLGFQTDNYFTSVSGHNKYAIS